MTGLDKMKDQILNEANNSASEIIAQAEREAEAILSKAREEAHAEGERISQKAETNIANHKERVASSVDLSRRKAILQAKQEVISTVLDEAYEKLTSLPDAAYFDMIVRMLNKFALGQEGEIYFSSSDLARMPGGFEAEISKIAETKGGKLVLSKEGKKIEDGFILVYGGIEENCTIQALFNSNRDELSDQVHKLLF